MAAFTLKKRIPVRDSDAFMEALNKIETGKVRTFIPLLSLLVESWEYDGDPSDPEAYDDRDLFGEYMPIVKAAEKYIADKLGNE